MTRFEWDDEKDRINQVKHRVGFYLAQYAFTDPQRVIGPIVPLKTGSFASGGSGTAY